MKWNTHLSVQLVTNKSCSIKHPGRGGHFHIKQTTMLAVLLRGLNFGCLVSLRAFRANCNPSRHGLIWGLHAKKWRKLNYILSIFRIVKVQKAQATLRFRQASTFVSHRSSPRLTREIYRYCPKPLARLKSVLHALILGPTWHTGNACWKIHKNLY